MFCREDCGVLEAVANSIEAAVRLLCRLRVADESADRQTELLESIVKVATAVSVEEMVFTAGELHSSHLI